MRSVLLVLLLAACGKEVSVVRGSCVSGPVCEDYVGEKKFVEGQKTACKSTWSDSPCALANLLGSCKETHGWTRVRNFYVGGDNDIAKVKAECGAYGTWVEPQH